MTTILKFAVFIVVLIYTSSYAVYEFKTGNKKGGAAVTAAALFAAVLFSEYMT